MPTSSWKHTALAALLSPVAVSGQQVIFIPRSSLPSSYATTASAHQRRANAMNMDSFLFGGGSGGPMMAGEEPPCRTRRLEPWRRQVRAQCLVEADSHCAAQPKDDEDENEIMETRDLRRKEWKVGYEDAFSPSSSFNSQEATLMSLEKEMDSFFENLFGPPRQQSPSSETPRLRNNNEGEDPFDKLLTDMLGFSLRAFDQVMLMDASNLVSNPINPPSTLEEGGTPAEEAEEVDSWSEAQDPPPPSKESSEDAADITPEQAAENALDVMVASLARAAAAPASATTRRSEDVAVEEAEELDEEEEGEEEVVEELEGEEEIGEEEEGQEEVGEEDVGLPSIGNLPQLLFQLGQNLLSETHSERRRLSEQGAEVDPRLRVEERLARRLTEYRTDLFYSPEGNTVTLYTTSSGPNFFPAQHSLMSASPFFGGVSSSPPPLGMGSSRVDECLRSRFNSGELKGTGCHRAVGEFLLAVDHGSPQSPHHAEFSDPEIKDDRILAEARAREQHEFDNTASAFLGLALIVAVALLVDHFVVAQEEEEGEDDDVDEFDYTTLPEDDEAPRVFVGLPVQVV